MAMSRRARAVDDNDADGDDDNADDAAAANVASLLLWRELAGGSTRRGARDRRGAAAAAATASRRCPRFLPPPPCPSTSTDPSAAALVWAEAALLRRARSRYLDLRSGDGAPAPRSTIAARFGADGSLLACSHGGDHAIRVWCGETGNALCVLRGHARTPWCVAWHPRRADTLASGGLDGAVLVWRLDPWTPPPPAESGDGSGMPTPPRLALQRRARGGADGGTPGADEGPTPPPPPHHIRRQPPPPLTPRLVARHDFRRPVASMAFAPSGDVLAVQAGRRMFAWRYGAEASPAASPRGAGGLLPLSLPLSPPPLPPVPGGPRVAAAVSSAAAAAATAPVEIYRAKNTLRMVAPHPVANVPLLLTAEVMPGATGGGGADGGAAAAGREGAPGSASPAAVSLRDLPRALTPKVAARMCAAGRVQRREGGVSSSAAAAAAAAAAATAAPPGRGRGDDADYDDDDDDDGARGPRAAAVAAALATLRLRLAEAEGGGGGDRAAGLAAAAANYGGGVPSYLLPELMGAASEAWARAGGDGGLGGVGGDGGDGSDGGNGGGGDRGESEPPSAGGAATGDGEQRTPRAGQSPGASLMRDAAWASRVRQWASRAAEEQLRVEEREAWDGGAPALRELAMRAAVSLSAEIVGATADVLLATPTAPLSPRPPPQQQQEQEQEQEQQQEQQQQQQQQEQVQVQEQEQELELDLELELQLELAAARLAGPGAFRDFGRLPSTAGPGLVAALPASTRTFSPEWLLPSSSPRAQGTAAAAAAAAAQPALTPPQPLAPAPPPPPPPPPQHPQRPPSLYDPHHPPLVTTGELPGYRRHWASDEAGGDRAVHLGGARPSARDGATAAAAAAAPALAAAAEAFRDTAIAACHGSQALPCLATLRLWRYEEEGGGGDEGGRGQGDFAGTTDDGDGGAAAAARPAPLPPAALPVRRPAPASLRPPRVLKIPYVVLCSEVSASISPCGRMLAAVVACRPASLQPGHPLLTQQGAGLEHAVYELRVFSIERPLLAPAQAAAPAAAAAGEEDARATGGAAGAGAAPATPAERSASHAGPRLRAQPVARAAGAAAAVVVQPLVRRLLRARAIPAGHCLTTVQYSPTGAHLILAYGRRHIHLCSLAATAVAAAGSSPGGSTAAPAADVVPVHSVVEFYRSDDLSLARVLPSLSDEVNAAAWRGGSGVWGGGGAAAAAAGFAYGTKDGRVRLVELG